jgi:hypothetical protein
MAAMGVVAIVAFTTVTSGLAGASSLCNKVTAAQVSSSLGAKATKVTTEVNGSVTVCWYQIGSNSHAAFVRTQTGDNVAGFDSDKKAAAAEDENPKSDLSFGKLLAFSTEIGSATYGYTFSVTVLSKSTELDVGGVTAKLSNVEGLAKEVLAKL